MNDEGLFGLGLQWGVEKARGNRKMAGTTDSSKQQGREERSITVKREAPEPLTEGQHASYCPLTGASREHGSTKDAP